MSFNTIVSDADLELAAQKQEKYPQSMVGTISGFQRKNG